MDQTSFFFLSTEILDCLNLGIFVDAPYLSLPYVLGNDTLSLQITFDGLGYEVGFLQSGENLV